MAPKIRLEGLEEQKRGPDGAPLTEKTLKEQAQEAAAAARRILPDGLPPSSPYATLTSQEVVAEAARYGFRLSGFVGEDDLRLITEVLRIQSTKTPQNKPRDPSPPVPHQPSPPLKIRGLKPSPSNRWRVEVAGDKPKSIAVGRGQMAVFHNGAMVEANHYGPVVLQGMVDQGLKLHPIEDPEPEE